MKKSYLLLSCITIITVVALFPACRKINDYTELGAGLIPPIDNIHTFDTFLSVEAYNDSTRFQDDSVRLGPNDEHFLGLINNDPVFGKTEGRIFVQLKPGVYGEYPFIRKDSVTIDSVVLVLSYVETYGDTDLQQSVRVYEVNQSSDFRVDSNYLIRKENFTYNTAFPLNDPFTSSFFTPRTLNDSIKVFRDTTANQLRIRLDTNFARRIFNYDTTDAFKSDSIFNTRFKGFAIRNEGPGNAIMGFNLNSVNTKLAFYYNCPKKGGGGRDTAVTYFFVTENSATASYISRDYSGMPFVATLHDNVPDDVVYLQNSPGTFSTIRIPALPGLSNRVVHKAELVAESIFDNSNEKFGVPDLLFVDFYDSVAQTYATSLYDFYLNSTTGGFNYTSYGCYPKDSLDNLGRKIKEWRFDMSRYVQGIVTGREKYYPLRIYAPFSSTFQYSVYNPGSNILLTRQKTRAVFNGAVARGRVMLNNNPASPTRMRLRIVYSKL